MLNKLKKWFLVLCILFAGFGIFCLGMLAVNQHFHFIFLEILSHYCCKISGAKAVVVGDSIAAGGRHWDFEIGLLPLRTRNLAGNGYTISQVAGQVVDAKKYEPEWLVVFGGTNDAFQLREGRISLERIREDLGKLLDAAAPVPVVYVLPPPTEYADVNATLETMRGEIVAVLNERNVPFVDSVQLLGTEQRLLKKEYSSDGVHLKRRPTIYWEGKFRKSFPCRNKRGKFLQPRNSRNDTKVQKGNGVRPARRAGSVFANPLASELADGLSKTPLHSLRE